MCQLAWLQEVSQIHLKGSLVVAALVFVFVSKACGQAPKGTRAEQVRFGLEESIDRPVPLPEAVLKILRQDSDIRACDLEQNSRDTIPAMWYEASEIHLDGPTESDLIVKAKNACLWGANIGPFWVFRKTPNGHSLVLSTVALGLQVLKTKTNAFRDIRAGAIASLKPSYVMYKFDGHNYQESDDNADKTK